MASACVFLDTWQPVGVGGSLEDRPGSLAPGSRSRPHLHAHGDLVQESCIASFLSDLSLDRPCPA